MYYYKGKAEGKEKLWHGHVTAVTVSPEYRRLGLAKLLMDYLELCSGEKDCYNSYFVDLFVRTSNALAIAMYRRLGYVVYRRVLDYYSGEEDAFGKALLYILSENIWFYQYIFAFVRISMSKFFLTPTV